MSSNRYHNNPRSTDRLSRIIRSTNHNYVIDDQNDPDPESPTRSKYKSRSKGSKLYNNKSRTSKQTKLKHKRSRYHGKSTAARRRQYKLYSLREIIDKISTKSSIISTNTAKETLITYYQTFTTSHELMDELDHRFFSVLPTEEEDKSAHPYISDTDSVSERHFRTKHDLIYDESKAYCIQVRVINLVTFWMKEYFMEDFNETEMLKQLKSFVDRVKGLRSKQKLPSIPYDDAVPTPISDVPPIPDINSEDNNIYSKLIHHNKEKDIVISVNKVSASAVSPTNNHYQTQTIKPHRGFTVHSNPLHPANTTANINIHTNENINKTMAPLVADTSQSLNSIKSMKTEQMERISTIISPIHPVDDIKDTTKMKRGYFPETVFVTKSVNNTVYIASNQLCVYSDSSSTESTVNSCVMINGANNTKVMIRNICDFYNEKDDKHLKYNTAEHKVNGNISLEQKTLQLHESPLKFKRHRNVFSKHSDESDRKQDDSNNKEVTENIVSTPMTSSSDLRDHSTTSFKMEDSRISVEEAPYIEDPVDNIQNINNNMNSNINNNNSNHLNTSNNNNNHSGNNIVRRYYVKDPSKYKSLADKIEKVLFKQKKTAPISKHFIQNRRSLRNLNKRDKSYSTSSICSMAQLGSSLSGSKLINERFEEKIRPLKEDFQNKVKNRDIAEQITLMTFKAFKRVRKREFIDQAWKCKDRLELAGNLCQLIDHFNCISRWVQVTILHCRGVKKRGRMIKKFIKIMDILLELNNFQSLCAVYGAITSSSIYALESGWMKVPEKHKTQFEEIKKYFITANNMANLRALHKERNPPMIPYTGIYLQDLIQTEERFKERMLREQMKSDYDFTGSGGVVFDHLSKMSKQIDNILIYAKTPYQNIEENHVLQKYILSEFADQAKLNDEDIYKISENVAKTDASA